MDATLSFHDPHSGKRGSVHFDGTKPCAECGKAGAAPNGLCMTCTTDAMDPTHKMKSAQGRAVQAHIAEKHAKVRVPRETTERGPMPEQERDIISPTVDATITLNAFKFGLAWQNAFLAHSEDDNRAALYRTLLVEFFPRGVQFIATDGNHLLRAWTPAKGHEDEPMPFPEEAPDHSVIVMDDERFAIGFIKTLTATAGLDGNEWAPVELTVDVAPPSPTPTLGSAFDAKVLYVKAFGQSLTCRLFEGEYPDWRRLELGITASERVDGMMLSPRTFKVVGQLKGVLGVECTFNGEARAIQIHGRGTDAEVRGLLMPMRRKEERTPKSDAAPIGGEDANEGEGV